MRLSTATTLVASLFAGVVLAKLPPLSDEAKAKAAEAANKAAWTDKVGAFQLCKSMDKVAAAYRAGAVAAGKAASGADPTPACADPGPYVAQVTPAASKPLEASGAHSPPGMATSPPSSKATSAEITGPRK
jgi:hypothetical protein